MLATDARYFLVLQLLLIWIFFSTNVIQILIGYKRHREFSQSKLNVQSTRVVGTLSRKTWAALQRMPVVVEMWSFQELAKGCLFEAIEVLVNVDFRSESSFDPQISADYKRIWGRLNDSLTELLAGPGWRERKSPRPRVLRKEGSRPVEVEITAAPTKETHSDDPDKIATLSSEERVAEKQTREAREKLEALMIEKLSLGAGKKPEYIEKLIATKKARRESALSLLMATFRAFTVMRSRN